MDPKYILGIAELDSQHEEIEKLFFSLQLAIEDKDHWHNVQEVLERLCEKLKYHFYAEETIMDVFAYPETQEHGRSHLGILKALEGFKSKTLTEYDIEQLRTYPMQLFFEQIINQDMRFAAFLQKNRERLGIQ